jgi:hypothetical protein
MNPGVPFWLDGREPHVTLFSQAEGARRMQERTWWESIKVEGGELLDRVKKIVHEGNVRRIIIKQGTRSVAEFPLTVGVVGAVLAPILAAIGALAALITDCTIEVERVETDEVQKQ